jgi:16S rRNA (guanine527-N7)-methyltransferase
MIASEAQARDWLASLAECDRDAMERLELLVALLWEENERQNLVSRSSLDAVWRRHIADSAQLLVHAPPASSPWMDLGTGGGFPGLVIAALRPQCEMLLIESRARRADWLERARLALGLDRTCVVESRLELVETREMAVISARAFAPLGKLLSLSARFSTSETLWLLPKGRSAQQELDELRGWRNLFHVKQSLTEPQAGIIVGQLLGRKGKSP